MARARLRTTIARRFGEAATCTVAASLALLAGCGGGSDVLGAPPASGGSSGTSCTGSCATAATYLTTGDVERVIAQGVAEARAQGKSATIAVVDRVGDVLAVYRMGDSSQHGVLVSTSAGNGTPAVSGGLEGLKFPSAGLPTAYIDHAAAIAKAVTGAYLSSEGNAFSTRTANQIVQDHFNPGVRYQPAGPLFGVQFSQLPCSDFSSRFSPGQPGIGPHRSPLGLSADPGGFPLYKSGTVVGGVGVLADGIYGVDADITNTDDNPDEAIAMAATYGYSPPDAVRADRIAVGGLTLRYTDIEYAGLKSTPASAASFDSLGAAGALIAVPGYSDGTVLAGQAFGQPASGIRSDGVDFPNQDAFVFVDAANKPRYPARGGTDAATLGAGALTQTEVHQVLSSALDVANRARAQIRMPLNTPARVTISVVDTNGEILGMVRGRDAPVFGSDVSLQKARTAAFFSSAGAAGFLAALPDAAYLSTAGPSVARRIVIGDYVSAARSFLDLPHALGDGAYAFTDRANGNLSRPFFPDGIDGNPPGPFSKPAGQWSPFSTGLQLDVSINAIQAHVLYVAGVLMNDPGAGCAGVSISDQFVVGGPAAGRKGANGFQIFPGSVPIFRGGTLVGGIGVSGDGVDQDDMIAFLGLYNASSALGGSIANAPIPRRADMLTPQGTRLRYVECPQAPFLDSTEDNVCDGK